jgi:hypothetical protein
MPDRWMPGAEIHDIGDHAPTDGGPAKAIAHITWDKNASAGAPQDWVSFDALVNYFTGSGAGAAPHIIWDPFSGRIAQLVPADSRSKSVVDSAGGTRTNRAGSVVIQVEAVFFPYCRKGGQVYPRLVDTPCAGWDRLHAWIASWGVPDMWPMGRPVDFTSHRSESVWESQGGWYAHAHVPENDHQDPGSWPAFSSSPSPAPPVPATTRVTVRVGQTLTAIAAAAGVALAVILGLNPDVARHPDAIRPGDSIVVPAVPGQVPVPSQDPVPAPSAPGGGFPGASTFGPGASNANVTLLGQMLVARGAARFYAVGPGPAWGDADRRATEAFQLAQGWTGSDADGIPGATTWDYLLTGKGHDIPAAAKVASAPAFPGAAKFGPGQSNAYVTQLGQQLVRKGYGRYYTKGPGPTWGKADRLNVQAFQRAQGWRGSGADGIPGPRTWALLFS